MQVSTARRKIQTAAHVCMVRPCNFTFNQQTAESNAFQHKPSAISPEKIQQQALEEFDTFVRLLQEAGIKVTVFEDSPQPYTPDSIFPNNWISSHTDGKVIVYPLLAPNRRMEKRQDIIDFFLSQHSHAQLIDWSHFEAEGLFLEGTGSMIMDRINQLVYACVSPRTHPEMIQRFCKTFDCRPVLFHATDHSGIDIYHTNVMMALGAEFAVVGLDSISREEEKLMVIEEIQQSGRELIPISMKQIEQFAGNMLEVRNQAGKSYLVMSKRAFDSLDETQLQIIQRYSEALVIPLDVIETYGGGSVRCMLTEVFY